LKDFTDISKDQEVVENIFSLWHSKLTLKSKEFKGKIQMQCPSFARQLEFIVDRNIISRTYSENILSKGFYIDDCHNKHQYYISEKSNTKEKDYYLLYKIWKPDDKSPENLVGYIAKKSLLEQSFNLIDKDHKVIVEISKPVFSLTYKVQIQNINHISADPNLIYPIIGKMAFSRYKKKETNISDDLCNTSYNLFNFIFMVSIVVCPMIIIGFLAIICFRSDIFGVSQVAGLPEQRPVDQELM